MSRSQVRAGVTLIELVLVLAIVGITSAVVLLAWRAPGAADETAQNALARFVADARRVALSSGRTQHMRFRLAADGTVLDEQAPVAGTRVHDLVALPDGSIIADSILLVDRLGGHPSRTPDGAP